MADAKHFRVMLWCVPRSASTAITKCFSFIENTEIWFEPYCMAFFQDFYAREWSGASLPRLVADFDVEAFMEQTRARLKGTSLEHIIHEPTVDESLALRDGARSQLNNLPDDKSYFVKDMAYGITNYLDCLPSEKSGFKHTFLIRDPNKVLPSWRRLIIAQRSSQQSTPGQAPIDDVTFDLTSVPYMMPGYSYKCQYDLWNFVRTTIDPNPVVIDADDILADPLSMLSKYARATGMPFSEEKLSWEASSDVISTWKCFYPIAKAKPGDLLHRTHAKAMFSSGFIRQGVRAPQRPTDLTSDVVTCIDSTMPYYSEMVKFKL